MAEQVIYKTPATTLPLVDVDFTDDLPGDSAIHASTSVVTAKDAAGGDVSATIVANTTRAGMILSADLKAGVEGQDYRVSFLAIGNTTSKPVERVIELRVRADRIGNL